MDTTQIWGILPEIVETLERSYNLFKSVMEDFKRYLSARQKNKIKETVLQIRRHVGEIDSIFSRLRAKIEIAYARNDTVGFRMHQEEIQNIYSRILNISGDLLDVLQHYESYLDAYPKLKDALHLKLESEHVDDYGDGPEIYADLSRFTWWVNVAGDYTRRALEKLNEHLESEY